MALFSIKYLFVAIMLFPAIVFLTSQLPVVSAVEDDIVSEGVDTEDETDATVEIDDTAGTDETAGETDSTVSATDTADDDEDEDKTAKASPDAETSILFTRPLTPTDLPAGRHVRLLAGFYNKGDKNFIVDSMDAAFRYPQDWSYYIQNFTSVMYDRTVEPGREATFDYAFIPSDTLSTRAFGLTVNLYYHDADGTVFVDAVYNSTVNIYEPDDGLDGETFFLYLFLVAGVILLIFAAFHCLSSVRKTRSSKPKAQIETGTQSNKADVDYDWLPKEMLDSLNKSSNQSPKGKASPRQRPAAAKRRSGAADD